MEMETSSGSSSIVDRVRAILLSPGTEWPVIAAEDASSRAVLKGYVLPLAAIGPVCGFLGSQLFGYGAFGFSYQPGFVSALIGALVAFVLALVSFMILTLAANFLSQQFGGQSDHDRAFKLVAYGSTPVWVVGVFSLYPPLMMLGVLALYSIYLIYLGVTPILAVPRPRALVYTAALILCGILLNLLVMGMSQANMRMLAGMGLVGATAEASGTVTAPDGSVVDMSAFERIGRDAEATASGQPSVPAEKLQALLPAAIGGYRRVSIENTAMGLGAHAEATYEDESEHSFTLKITDMSVAGALAGLGAALGMERSREDSDGYERTGTVDGRMQTESWRNTEGSGQFGVVMAKRFMVEADGTAASVDELKSAVSTISEESLADLVK